MSSDLHFIVDKVDALSITEEIYSFDMLLTNNNINRSHYIGFLKQSGRRLKLSKKYQVFYIQTRLQWKYAAMF